MSDTEPDFHRNAAPSSSGGCEAFLISRFRSAQWSMAANRSQTTSGLAATLISWWAVTGALLVTCTGGSATEPTCVPPYAWTWADLADRPRGREMRWGSVTVAVSLKVHEGVVLASDSASTLAQVQADGAMSVANVYYNVDKIANLVKELPLGVMTWGAGSIGPESISTLFKDLRQMLTGERPGPDGADWKVDPSDYAVADVADRVREFIYRTKYAAVFGGNEQVPDLGLVVAGYSTDGPHAEAYRIEMDSGGCPAPAQMWPGAECGFFVGGQPAAVMRLVHGVDPRAADVLVDALGVSPRPAGRAAAVLREQLSVPLVQEPMPFKDALDLAEFFVDVTCRYTKFLPVGATTVGGPIVVAGITKHEGFKWIKREHFYSTGLNPAET